MFRGVLAAWGGSSTNSEHGSPGTVYIQTNIGDDEYKLLFVNNLNRDEKFQVLLDETATDEYRFDEVKLIRKATLALKKVSSLTLIINIVVHMFHICTQTSVLYLRMDNNLTSSIFLAEPRSKSKALRV